MTNYILADVAEAGGDGECFFLVKGGLRTKLPLPLAVDMQGLIDFVFFTVSVLHLRSCPHIISN